MGLGLSRESDASSDSCAQGIPQTPNNRHHGQFIVEAVHRRSNTNTGGSGSDRHRHCDGGEP